MITELEIKSNGWCKCSTVHSEPGAGIEPATFPLPRGCSTTEPPRQNKPSATSNMLSVTISPNHSKTLVIVT